jgi:hypothetical protein
MVANINFKSSMLSPLSPTGKVTKPDNQQKRQQQQRFQRFLRKEKRQYQDQDKKDSDKKAYDPLAARQKSAANTHDENPLHQGGRPSSGFHGKQIDVRA